MRPQYSDPNYPCASAYLEHYLESVEALPHDLQRNFTQLREIDAKIQDFVERLDQIGRTDLTVLYSMDPSERAHRLADIQSLLETCLQYGNEKDRLAAQTYDMVEQHVRKLDMDAENYDNEVKEIAKRPVERTNTNTSTSNAAAPTEGSVKRAKPATEANKEKNSAKPAAKKAKKEKVAATPKQQQETKARQPAKPANGEAHEENEHDEAKYCICEQVSYGEMVGCDNDQCPVEWFHFSCVGLSSKPKGKWYCPECRDTMSKASSRAR